MQDRPNNKQIRLKSNTKVSKNRVKYEKNRESSYLVRESRGLCPILGKFVKNKVMKPVEVRVLQDYQLNVVFDDGVSGVIDLKDFIKKGVFAPLRDVQLFKKVYITHSSIAWSEELEIDALTIYAEILKKQPSEIVQSSLQHAAD